MSLELTHPNNLYKDVDPDSIRTATSAISDAIKGYNENLTTTGKTLLEDESKWKGSAKEPVKTAITEMTGTVFSDINTALEEANVVAGLVETYKTEWKAAKAASEAYNTAYQTHETNKKDETSSCYNNTCDHGTEMTTAKENFTTAETNYIDAYNSIQAKI